MNITKLKAKRDKLSEKIRQAEQREREQKERQLLKLAHKHGLLAMEQPALETALANIAVTESEPSSDTVAPNDGGADLGPESQAKDRARNARSGLAMSTAPHEIDR